jgi:hypothetical protein
MISLLVFVAVPILSFAVFIYYKNYLWLVNNERVYLDRFHIFATELHLYNPQDDLDEDEDFTSDPTLRRLMGKENNSNENSFKRVSTRVTVDFEEVVSLSEWSTSRYEDKNIVSDSTMLFMRNGDQILVLESFDVVMSALEIYLGKRHGR